MDIKIIFSDIDGTLINQHYQITPRTREALKNAIDQNIIFVPVSARMPEAIATVTDQLTDHCPMIAYNGALILDEHKNVVASHPLPGETAREICQLIEVSYPDVAWNVYGNHTWLSQSHRRERIEFEEDVVKVLSTPAVLDDILTMQDVHKLLLMGEPEHLDIVETNLKTLYPQLSIARSSRILLEIMNQGIRKGAAISQLCDYYHIVPEDTLSFGDNYNDLDMLKTTGMAYVMGNAPKEIKGMIHNVTDDNNHDGIAAVLESLL